MGLKEFLFDVDDQKLKRFNGHENFVSNKDGVLMKEFFKFLGNLFEADHAKLCQYILNQCRPFRR